MEKKYHHGDLKTQLIETGLRMISEDGIQKLSLRKLAQSCGVSEAAPYSHFKNKDDLLTAMQEYITGQLQRRLEDAYEHTEPKGSTDAILNMGKAYVMFFIEYPQYNSFLFSHAMFRVDLSMKGEANDFGPFRYYKEKAFEVYRQKGMDDERIKYGVISMWAQVYGIAAIASLKGVKTDFEWEDELERILVG
ncbi:MAG: TetR/AcrR family transcriptional regulator [Eubacterium sp.]|nr:TetR/AcrR family transcriptional regulator [Eubacterium sp.]